MKLSNPDLLALFKDLPQTQNKCVCDCKDVFFSETSNQPKWKSL